MRLTLFQQSWGNHIEVSQAVYLYVLLSVYAHNLLARKWILRTGKKDSYNLFAHFNCVSYNKGFY
jgi:hypothetical protein